MIIFSGPSSYSGTLVGFSMKIDGLALTFPISLYVVLLRSPETSLRLWLYGNGFITRAALFGSCGHILK